jgi:hypothetical protein
MSSTHDRDGRADTAGISRAFAAGLGAVLQAADVLAELGAESAAQAVPAVRSAARAADRACRGHRAMPGVASARHRRATHRPRPDREQAAGEPTDR